MSSPNDPLRLTTAAIRAERGPKVALDPKRPYAFLTESEYGPDGKVATVATLFLTNRECPFTCLMCDLWRHTLDDPLQPGFIPKQIRYALDRLAPAKHIKLYNSGNFFDRRAIPTADWADISALVAPFERVIVENHPRLCDERVLRFRDRVKGQLELALGLETIHPQVLPRLNKQMTLDDFARAVDFLRRNDIDVRCFILLRPPFLSEAEGLSSALETLRWAFNVGVQCGAVIPTRGGNGIMERLAARGQFAPPTLRSMEMALDEALSWNMGRVFMDLWDAHQFARCPACAAARIERLHQMNLTQTVLPPLSCTTCGHAP